MDIHCQNHENKLNVGNFPVSSRKWQLGCIALTLEDTIYNNIQKSGLSLKGYNEEPIWLKNCKIKVKDG